MKNLDISKLIQKKPITSITEEALKQIKLISLKQYKIATPFGSSIYRIQKYPSDIDLIEIFEDCCSVDEVINKVALKIKKIVKEILSKKNEYFSELKAGLDKRYEIDIGECINGSYKPNTILIKNIITDYYKRGLLDKNEIRIIISILEKENQNGDDYDIIKYIFRERTILRWESQEIIRGYKKLPGNEEITLSEALKMKSHVKIDIISYLEGSYVEITNFMILAYSDKKGNYTFINTNVDYHNENEIRINFIKTIKEEIEKLYYSNMYYNPFKMVKRIFSYARFIRDERILERIIPIYASDISLGYKITSDISTILRLYEITSNLPLNEIKKELQLIKEKIVYVIEIPKQKIEIINNLIKIFNNQKENNKITYSILKSIKSIIKTYINELTIQALNSKGLNPPPRQYLPMIMKYKQITRLKTENPENPIDQYN